MKTALAPLALLFASACSGPEVPSAFRPDSPSSPAAPPGPRLPVAAVLAAADPSEATVCAPGQPCVLSVAEGKAPAVDHSAHHHHHHGTEDAKPPPPQTEQPPSGHEGHSGHHP